MTYYQTIGKWGENQSCQFLLRKGFVIIDRNYHSTQGEIDIVAQKGEDYYFIEVKTRQCGALATDLSITTHKKHRFYKTIKHFCYHKHLVPKGSIIVAGLLVVVYKKTQKVIFRLAAFY